MLGPNGAGKTTLLRMLFGLIAADRGEIELFGPAAATPIGRPPSRGRPGSSRRRRSTPTLSGRANLELLAQLDGAGARGRIEQALERVVLA